MELSTFLCTCKHAVNVHESVYLNPVFKPGELFGWVLDHVRYFSVL